MEHFQAEISINFYEIKHTGRTADTLHGTTHDGRELMRSNSERDRHMTNHHASTLSHRKAYRDPHDSYRDHSASNGMKGMCFFLRFSVQFFSFFVFIRFQPNGLYLQMPKVI